MGCSSLFQWWGIFVLYYIQHSALSVTAPNIIHARQERRPVMRLYSAAAQPASSTSASHVLCRRSGVKPKQSMYSASFDNAITANSMLSASSVTHRARLTLRSLTGGLLIRVTSHSSTKFSAMTRHSSKKPCRAYSATVKSTGSVRVNAPNMYPP